MLLSHTNTRKHTHGRLCREQNNTVLSSVFSTISHLTGYEQNSQDQHPEKTFYRESLQEGKIGCHSGLPSVFQDAHPFVSEQQQNNGHLAWILGVALGSWFNHMQMYSTRLRHSTITEETLFATIPTVIPPLASPEG